MFRSQNYDFFLIILSIHYIYIYIYTYTYILYIARSCKLWTCNCEFTFLRIFSQNLNLHLQFWLFSQNYKCTSIANDCLQRPTLLSYCCYLQQTMPLSHYTPCCHAVKNTSQRKEETDNTGHLWYETRSQDSQLSNIVIFKEIQIINTIVWLFNDRSLYCLS